MNFAILELDYFLPLFIGKMYENLDIRIYCACVCKQTGLVQIVTCNYDNFEMLKKLNIDNREKDNDSDSN